MYFCQIRRQHKRQYPKKLDQEIFYLKSELHHSAPTALLITFIFYYRKAMALLVSQPF